jgi:hypothetical protein
MQTNTAVERAIAEAWNVTVRADTTGQPAYFVKVRDETAETPSEIQAAKNTAACTQLQ